MSADGKWYARGPNKSARLGSSLGRSGSTGRLGSAGGLFYTFDISHLNVTNSICHLVYLSRARESNRSTGRLGSAGGVLYMFDMSHLNVTNSICHQVYASRTRESCWSTGRLGSAGDVCCKCLAGGVFNMFHELII